MYSDPSDLQRSANTDHSCGGGATDSTRTDREDELLNIPGSLVYKPPPQRERLRISPASLIHTFTRSLVHRRWPPRSAVRWAKRMTGQKYFQPQLIG